MLPSRRPVGWLSLPALVLAAALPAGADSPKQYAMNQILVGAIDQPKLRAGVRLGPDSPPLDAPGIDLGLGDLFDGIDLGGDTYTIEGFADTGAGVILIGPSTASAFGLPIDAGAQFTDVGIAGSDSFDISQAVQFQFAHFDDDLLPALDDPTTFDTVYNRITPEIRAAVGPRPHGDAPVTDDLDQLLAALSEFNVFGMPALLGRSMVMDSRSLNDAAGEGEFREFGDLISDDALTAPQLKTFLYESPNAPSPQPAMHGPGPSAPSDVVIKTSYADFGEWTETNDGYDPPSLAHNPFIGANPLSSDTSDPLPGVTASLGGQSVEGSWLADTGAAASIFSQKDAATLGVSYSTETGKGLGGDDPTLVDSEGNPLPDQFMLTLGGVGGQLNVAGFWLDGVVLPAWEDDGMGGQRFVELVFNDVPVLVADISITHPETGETLTLDGILGMNFFFPSLYIDQNLLDNNPLAVLGLPMVTSNFDMITFDEPTGEFRMTFNPDVVPEPATGLLLALGLVTLGRRRG